MIRYNKVLCCCCRLVTKLCPTLCNPMDCSLPGSSVCGILQARTLESGLPFPSPGGRPNPGIKPFSPALAGRFLTAEPPGKLTRVEKWILESAGISYLPTRCRDLLSIPSLNKSGKAGNGQFLPPGPLRGCHTT